jgi:L-lactate dehydrogenase (cytochrome)
MGSQRSRLDQCHSIGDLRHLARARLPGPLFDYIDGAAESEITARRNSAAFDDHSLVPRCLVDVTSVTTRTQLLGQRIEWPLICSPTGASRFYHPDGELAVARAAARSGAFYGLSTMATTAMENIAGATSGPKLFQLYVFKDRDLTRELIQRCKRAGFHALCLTVDAAVRGKRERELRSGLGVPMRLSLSSIASFARYPRWLFAYARSGSLTMPNVAAPGDENTLLTQTQFIGEQLDASVTWKDVREIVDLWGGPFVLKGIMAVDDARQAIDAGVSALMISNHGGRQLDGAASPIEVLPEIATAVRDRLELILDGGVRRGVHILKALARGAKACAIGRPYLYGLAAGGERGVDKALEILSSELVRAMQLSGCADVNGIDANLIRLIERRDPRV